MVHESSERKMGFTGCLRTSELDYPEQTSWLLFLKYPDALEHDKATEAALRGRLTPAPFRVTGSFSGEKVGGRFSRAF